LSHAALDSLREMEEMSRIAGLGQFLEHLLEVHNIVAKNIIDVLKFLNSLTINVLILHPNYP
jgi:hypothetical protein